ncbi:MAG: RnfABCDGE type electron transport complex subunit G [Xanthomonadales bacterium]|nr:RnfABCDGE type electron transport complex subunit G [Xanthomonadales bacterium]
MSDKHKSSLHSIVMLTLAAALTTLLLSGLFQHTKPRIDDQRQAAIEATLSQVIPGIEFDNRLQRDRQAINAPGFFQTDQALWWYPVRLQGQTQAIILDVIAPDGYNGDIRLLVGINRQLEVTGVRVTQHLETPGLGDAIEYQKSPWVDQLIGRRLVPNSNEPEAGSQWDHSEWAVRRQGGDFDAITGATVTSSAMIAVVERSLEYAHRQRDRWFLPVTQSASPGPAMEGSQP